MKLREMPGYPGYLYQKWSLTHNNVSAVITRLPSYGGEEVYTVSLMQRQNVSLSRAVHGFLSAQLAAIEMIDNYLERSDV